MARGADRTWVWNSVMKGVDEVIVSLEWRHAVGFGKEKKAKAKVRATRGAVGLGAW